MAVTLDVKYAFHSASCYNILTALNSFFVPPYLYKIIASYFDEWTLSYKTSKNFKEHKIISGMQKRSVNCDCGNM